MRHSHKVPTHPKPSVTVEELAPPIPTIWKIAAFYLLVVQPLILFVLPLIRFDEFRFGANDSVYGFGVSVDAWRNFLITIYGIRAGLSIRQNPLGAVQAVRRFVCGALYSALALLLVPFLISFRSAFRTEIRIDQAMIFFQAFILLITWAILLKRARIVTETISSLESPNAALYCRPGILGAACIAGLALSTAAFWTRPTDIFEAAWEGDLATVREFIKQGVNVNLATEDQNSALHLAKTKDVAEYLLEARCPVDIRNAKNETPLHVAAFVGRSEVCVVLVDHGAGVNLTNLYGVTPLDHALLGKGRHWRGNYDSIIAFLTEHGGKTGAELEEEAKRNATASAADSSNPVISDGDVGSGPI